MHNCLIIIGVNISVRTNECSNITGEIPWLTLTDRDENDVIWCDLHEAAFSKMSRPLFINKQMKVYCLLCHKFQYCHLMFAFYLQSELFYLTSIKNVYKSVNRTKFL